MDIKKIVTDYIKAENTDYAIMVTGVWGSGKTFCWNHTLKQAIEEIRIPGQDTENAKKYLLPELVCLDLLMSTKYANVCLKHALQTK